MSIQKTTFSLLCLCLLQWSHLFAQNIFNLDLPKYQSSNQIEFRGHIQADLTAPTLDIYANEVLLAEGIEFTQNEETWYVEKKQLSHALNPQTKGEVRFVVKDNGQIIEEQTQTVYSVQAQTDKKVLVEEFAGTWCPWCTQGDVVMDSIMEAHEEDFIKVGVRWADVMTVAGGDTIAGLYANGSPSAAFNRIKFGGQFNVGVPWGDWTSIVNTNFGSIAPFDISIDHVYNEETQMLDIDVHAKSLGNFEGNYRVNCYLVQDLIMVEDDPEYYQANGFDTVEGHPYYQAGEFVSGYPFKDVVREIFGGPWGEEGSIPMTTTNQSIYTTSYSYQMPDSLINEAFTLVAFVQEYTDFVFDRPILNASSTPMLWEVVEDTVVTPIDTTGTVMDTTDMPMDTTGIASDTATVYVIQVQKFDYQLYPNPAQQDLFLNIDINASTELTITLFDLQGKPVKNWLPTQRLSSPLSKRFNVADLPKGIYLLQLDMDGTSYWEKVVIN